MALDRCGMRKSWNFDGSLMPVSMPFSGPHCLAFIPFLWLIWQRFIGYSKLRYTNLITFSTQLHVGFIS